MEIVGAGGQRSQVPTILQKEEVMVQAMYVRTPGTGIIRGKKQPSHHVLFDEIINCAEAIRRYYRNSSNIYAKCTVGIPTRLC